MSSCDSGETKHPGIRAQSDGVLVAVAEKLHRLQRCFDHVDPAILPAAGKIDLLRSDRHDHALSDVSDPLTEPMTLVRGKVSDAELKPWTSTLTD